eukprot:2094769-Heterocapsa_arctica.AAC.1
MRLGVKLARLGPRGVTQVKAQAGTWRGMLTPSAQRRIPTGTTSEPLPPSRAVMMAGSGPP